MSEKKVNDVEKEEVATERKEEQQEDSKTTEMEELKKQVEDYKDKWIRNVAEFDNYKKRTANDWKKGYDEGIASVIVKILPVGDNLDYALGLGLDQKTEDGIKAIKKKFLETLESLEVVEIDPLGKQFDPNEAEAIMQADGDEGEESGTVKQIFQKGYKRQDKIIRYAKVSVVK